MKKTQEQKYKKIGYYTLIFRRLGQEKLLDESIIFATKKGKETIGPSELGEFAAFNADFLKNNITAEKYFIKSIEKEPDNSFWLGNYAIFLHYYKEDINLAEQYYLKSLHLDNQDAFLLYNYALLLLFKKKDYARTELLLKKAIHYDALIPKFQCTYAGFLFKIKKDFENAEKLLKKITTKTKNPQYLATYAQLEIFKNNLAQAENYINQAFELSPPDEIKLELWFYRYAHFAHWYEKAEKAMNKILKSETKSYAWGLKRNVVIALFAGHPNPEKLENYANKIIGVFKV